MAQIVYADPATQPLPPPPPQQPPPPNVTNLPAHPMTPTPPAGYALPGFSLDQPAQAAPVVNDPNSTGLTNTMATNRAIYEQDAQKNQIANAYQPPGALDYARVFLTGHQADRTALDTQGKTAASLNTPEALAYRQAHPENEPVIAQDPDRYAAAFDQATAAAKLGHAQGIHTYQTPDGGTKTVQADNPAHLQAQSAILGEHPGNILPMMEPHQFTESEFRHAISGMTWNQAARIFGMQHYQTPQQQLIPAYVGGLHNDANAAEKAYNDAVAAGKPPAEQKTAKDNWEKLKTHRDSEIQKLINGPNYLAPDQQQQ